MTSSIKRKYRKIYSTFMATLMLVQNFVPALFVFLPKNVYASNSLIETSEVELSFNSDNEFSLSVESSEDISYLLEYTDKSSQTQKAIKGIAVSNGVNAQDHEFAGTCSDGVCLEDEVESGSLILSENNFNSDFIVSNDQLWMVDGDLATVSNVELDTIYSAPQNSEVQVTFTKLPENLGSLSIQKIELTNEQVEMLGAYSSVAYDITSNMADGTFEYDLKLSLPEGADQNSQLVYAESVEELLTPAVVENKTVIGGEVIAEGLDHFTVFVVTDDDASYSAPWVDYATQGYLNTGVHYPTNIVAGETATWDFSTLAPGTYGIYISWSTHPNRTTAAPYDLTHVGGTESRTINQEQLADQTTTGVSAQWSNWHYYGEYNLDASSNLVLTGVDNSSGSEYVIADEVLLTSMVSAPVEVWVDDDYGLNLNNDGHVWGYDAFDSIQDAVDQVQSDGVVHVKEGNYQEQVIINKSLDLLGENSPHLVSVGSPTSYKLAESTKTFEPIIFAYGGTLSTDTVSGSELIDVVIDGFDIDGDDRLTSGGKRSAAVLARNINGAVNNNVIHNMSIGASETFGVVIYGNSDVRVGENSISEYSRGGISISGDNASALDPISVVINNQVSGPGDDTEVVWAPNGIQVGYGATGIVDGNTVTGNGWPGPEWSGTGILIVDTSDVIVKNNLVQNNEQAIGVVDFPESLYGSAWSGIVSNIDVIDNTVTSNSWGLEISNESSDVTVTGNHFADTENDGIDVYTYGVGVTPPTGIVINSNSIESSGLDGLWVGDRVTDTVDAVKNWWGDASGPSGDGSGSGQTIIGNASYCPWLTTSDLNNPTYAGDCLGYVQGRTFTDLASNGLLLSADGDYPDGMQDDFTVRLYDSAWNVLGEQTTRTTSKIGQYYFEDLLDEGNTYRVCGVQEPGYQESVPALGQHVVNTSGGSIPSQYSDAVIVSNGSSASDEFSRCWETTLNDGNGAYLGVGYVDSVAPSIPTISGFLSPTLSCGAVTNIHSTTVDWTDSTDLGSGFDHYEYNIDYPKPDGTRGDWTTTMVPSQYSGSLNEGAHHVRVRGVDVLGNISAWSNTCTITTDWTNPITTLASPNDDDRTNQAITIAGESTDENIVAQVNLYYRETGDTSWIFITNLDNTGNTEPFSFAYDWTPSVNGTFDIKVSGTDTAGNVESSAYAYGITYDSVSPTITLDTPIQDSVIAGSIALQATCDEECDYINFWWRKEGETYSNVSPDKRYHYEYANGTVFNWTLDSLNAERWGGDPSYVMSDGTYYLYAAGKDTVGNWAKTSEVRIVVDNTSPTSEITTFDLADGGETQTATFSGLVEGTATDGSGSGIDHVLLLISHLDFGADESETKYWDATSSAWINSESTFRAVGTTLWSYQLSDIPEGIYNVTSHAVDVAGNVESTYTIRIVYDKTIPEVNLTIDPTSPDGNNGWYKTNPSITLTASDNYSLDHIEYQWNSTAGSWTVYSADINLPGEGQNILYYRSIDTVGNVSDLGIKEVKYDTTAPVESPLSVRVENIGSTTATGKWEKPGNVDDIHEYRLSWRHKETGEEHSATVDSNIFEHELDSLSDGLWEFKVFAVDSAGNSKSASTDFRVGPEPEVLGVTTESQPETFVGVLGQVAGVFSNNQASDKTETEEDGSSEEKVVAEDGKVAGASDDICGAWDSYLPLILLILQVVLLLATEIMNREASLKKILMMMGLSLLTIALFYLLKKPACYTDGSMMSFINKWFVMISLGLSILIKFAASISIEDK